MWPLFISGIIATKPRPGAESSAQSAFNSAYSAAGGDAEGIYTHETYDAVKIIAHAALEGSDDIRDDLASVGSNYDGASGVHNFDSNGDVAGTGYEVCQFDPAFTCTRVWTASGGLASQ